ncbi:MAG: riboflavin biosynthesis protein RibD [Novosphingobium sp. 28-62-57]|uniref:bifunctional diaminohydroxyphosphoribosylaminopyrimidine deaminase/5-amino-6-(5-phosphoribosylamino)uracil reductase RibD n=1 Tax=unclassified Novosphingobium TaxID=2644732 RepID=UPI000BC592B1|nr:MULTISPECIES: bifunctional diaminohydroxyphosphoribosylaminopyrimidine deaminase/5-amino-6-(5-phosphoribosylamino)uracil reductase RibD [unclassified Novosphingobium]OYW48673.1 MAG: riboflavin biosynthesis protein RibD [Novosphingobium sp. 12-62-10]OYZ10225.1 MAG: riboflavin biosynthesis protein RibD [Novosphingobium sp. 28-62-57]OZA34862.1 MAG: riboflavin biosynthesis protein RibD [Novosphingobium sp. 17-62-9]HQS70436.1 bifunctional diaminohydroxyphosphoribosylaminopyrimidine deaminase/5-am
MNAAEDQRWLNAAAALAGRGRPLSRPNPSVGAVIVRDGKVVGRGWTQAGGRPHAEAGALAMAGAAAKGATLYVTLEPCAHASARGPSCTSLVLESGLARVVIGVEDPDPRTAGSGIAAMRAAGISAELVPSPAAHQSLAGYLTRTALGRPHVTLKLATSLDGRIALPDGTSQWITGPEARAHCHVERAQADAILVGGSTFRADAPKLDVRLPGLEHRSPQRMVLTRGPAPEGWTAVPDIAAPTAFGDAQYLFVEGGAQAAAAFLAADMVDRLLLYRAPIIVGAGLPCIGDIGLGSLADAHGRWRNVDRRTLGSDALDVYERVR